MSVGTKIWDSIASLLRVNGDIERLNAAAVLHQQQIESLSVRLARLEGAEMARAAAPPRLKGK